MPSTRASAPFLDAWDTMAERARVPADGAVAQAARRSWLDTVAATAAGMAENSAQAARRSCAAPQPLSAVDAALVLGTAAHALDYDDVCMLATCHPSAPPTAALLAVLPQLARQRPALTWGELLSAYLVGTETMLRLGEWLGFRHYALGFHATGTLGTVGCAAAVAHALQLPQAAAHAALAIAASSAGGLRANFGTDTKPLHVGMAASAGVRAAQLAAAGASASDDVWGPEGFAQAFNGGQWPGPLAWHGDAAWAALQPGFELKRYPSCYMTHRLIAGTWLLRARWAARADAPLQCIDIELPHQGSAPLKHPQATTGLQAKFSGPYCAAAAWLDGAVGLAAFTDAAVLRPQAQALMRQVVVRERADAGERLDTAPVRVQLCGEGWSDEVLVDWAPGSAADPMTRDELAHKWSDCVAHGGLALVAEQGAALLDAPLETRALALLGPLRAALLGSG
jgi:2-methylcitrate dehydratase PrpD